MLVATASGRGRPCLRLTCTKMLSGKHPSRSLIVRVKFTLTLDDQRSKGERAGVTRGE
mgnify:CR=1 FL=1